MSIHKICSNCGKCSSFYIVDKSFTKDGFFILKKVSQCVQCGSEADILSFPLVHPVDNIAAAPQKQKCAFDGLPPGTYGLVCNCPKCRVTC